MVRIDREKGSEFDVIPSRILDSARSNLHRQVGLTTRVENRAPIELSGPRVFRLQPPPRGCAVRNCRVRL